MITTKATLPEFVEQMIAKMNTVMEQYTPTIHAKNLTNQQVLTLASLVEKESQRSRPQTNCASILLTAWLPICQSNQIFLFCML